MLRKYLQCRRICFIFLLLFIISFGRQVLFTYVNTTKSSSNRIINFLLSRVNIQSEISNDTWIEKYPFSTTWVENIEEKFNKTKEQIVSFSTTSFPCLESINLFITNYKTKILNYNLNSEPGAYGMALETANSLLNYVEEPVNNVITLKEYCDKEKVPFIYVATPSQDSINYYLDKKDEVTNWEIINRQVVFLKGIEEGGVETLNIARELALKHNFAFDSSFHWFPSDAVYSAGTLAEILNEHFGFEFNIELFNQKNYYDLMTEHEEVVNTIRDNCKYTYELSVPLESKKYSMMYAEKDEIKGDFLEVFISPEENWNLVGGAYHQMFRISNSLIFVLTSSKF